MDVLFFSQDPGSTNLFHMRTTGDRVEVPEIPEVSRLWKSYYLSDFVSIKFIYQSHIM